MIATDRSEVSSGAARDPHATYFVLGSVHARPNFGRETTKNLRTVPQASRRQAKYRSVKDAGKLVVLSLCTMTSLAARVAHTENERLMLTVCLSAIGFLVTSNRSNGNPLGAFSLGAASGADGYEASGPIAGANPAPTADVSVAARYASQAGITASSLEQRRERMLAMVSHELRSPIAAIMMAAEIITDHHNVNPDVVDRFGRAIGCEGERLMRLLDDYVDLSRIDSGSDEWVDCDVDAAKVVEDVLAGLERHASMRGVQLIDGVEPGLPSVRVDPRRLAQVLTNLTYNAISHTPRGGSVTVRATMLDGEIRFGVDDMRDPVSEEDAGIVLDRSALGLLLSRDIVRHYEGRMWTEANAGHGAGIRFAIPVFRRAAFPDSGFRGAA